MELLIVRHGKAGDSEEWIQSGKSDDLRPLTEKGVVEFGEASSALVQKGLQIHRVVSSPLVRAYQTAEILAENFEVKRVEVIPELRPWTDFQTFGAWLAKQPSEHKIALVGHEPHLSQLASWLMTGRSEPILFFKKGGMAHLTTESAPKPGAFILNWHLQPKLLIEN